MTIERRPIALAAVPYAFMLTDGIGYVRFTSSRSTAGTRSGTRCASSRSRACAAWSSICATTPAGCSIRRSRSPTCSSRAVPRSFPRAGACRSRIAYDARDNDDFSVHPMIVLVNQASASASEIVSGALQDHDRALLVGQTTWGKGLVQSLFPLDDGYFLKLTTARYYTPERPEHPARRVARHRLQRARVAGGCACR